MRAQEGVCSECVGVRAVCACVRGYVHAQEGVCTERERVRAYVQTCASMCELACGTPVCGVRTGVREACEIESARVYGVLWVERSGMYL